MTTNTVRKSEVLKMSCMTPCASATLLEKVASLKMTATQIDWAWRPRMSLRVAQARLRADFHSMPYLNPCFKGLYPQAKSDI
jgi:hypothetical protein